MKIIWNFILRVIAVFIMSALSIIAAGSLLQIDIVKCMILAGIVGLAKVAEDIAREFINDGNLTQQDLDKILKNISETYKIDQ